MGKSSKTIIGSSKVALTAEAVYNVALCRTLVEPDSVSLEQISLKKPKVVSIIPGPSDGQGSSGQGQLLLDTEVRATLVVLTHKLLLGQAGIRTFLPIFLTEILNLGLKLDIPASNDDYAVIQALIGNIYRIKNSVESLGDCSQVDEADSELEIPGIGQLAPAIALSRLRRALEKSQAGEIGVTPDEVAALESSFAASIGVATLASYYLNSLTVVADAVAALSCEALLANTEAFESESFKQAFVRKSEADVASDLNALLFGSKLVKARKGGVDAEYIYNLPAAHGALRDAVKLLAPRLRVEINRIEIVSKRKSSTPPSASNSVLASSSATQVSSSLFTSTLLSLLVSLWPNVSGSSKRSARSLDFIRELCSGNDLSPEKCEEVYAKEIESVRSKLQLAAAKVATFGDESNEVFLSRETLSVVETWRGLLAKESTLALALLCIRERLSAGKEHDVGQSKVKEQVSRDNAGANGASKSAGTGRPAKIKKDFVIGKGTDIVRKCLAAYLDAHVDLDFSKLESLTTVGRSLDVLFSPHVPELQALATEVKGVLESNETRRLPKIAKGTRDFKPEQMAIREKAFGIIASVFKRHGAVALDTPVFELRETLMGKYGEDSKLIYDLADQGGEILSLRYDLTVPFARYLAMNKVENLKRYHIARVYRRDNPAKGRYREFYQCDFDIAGQYAPMVPDFEVLKVLTELLNELDIGDYEVKLNHRRLLDGMLDICGVPQAKFRSICSAIDKLDKNSWEEVRKEMIEQKGLSPETADKIGELVQKRGAPLILLEDLKQTGSPFLQHSGSTAALGELDVLFKYLKASKCIDRFVFDLSLARGLDYYTGVIYEAVFKGSTQVGSIAAGGRYDNLVGMFSGKQVPAVGVSLGIERVFAIMEKQEEDRKSVVRSNQTEVLVVVLGKDERWTEVAIDIVTELWEGKLKAEFACVARAKVTQQITNAATAGIRWVVIAGEDEMRDGIVRLKNIATREQDDIRRESLVAELQRRVGVAVELPTVVQ